MTPFQQQVIDLFKHLGAPGDACEESGGAEGGAITCYFYDGPEQRNMVAMVYVSLNEDNGGRRVPKGTVNVEVVEFHARHINTDTLRSTSNVLTRVAGFVEAAKAIKPPVTEGRERVGEQLRAQAPTVGTTVTIVGTTVTIVIDRMPGARGTKAVYLADDPDKKAYFLDLEARSAAIIMALEHVQQAVARYQQTVGKSGAFKVVVDVDDRSEG